MADTKTLSPLSATAESLTGLAPDATLFPSNSLFPSDTLFPSSIELGLSALTPTAETLTGLSPMMETVTGLTANFALYPSDDGDLFPSDDGDLYPAEGPALAAL